MKARTIIGIVFIVASLTKLATIWGIIEWNWFAKVSEEPWVTYFCICLLIYVGVNLIIDSYRRDPDQWLQRPLPIGEDGKRICCSVHYGGDEYIYRGEPFHGARLDACKARTPLQRARGNLKGVATKCRIVTSKDKKD